MLSVITFWWYFGVAGELNGKFKSALEFSGGHVLGPDEDVMNLRQWTMTAWIKVRQ